MLAHPKTLRNLRNRIAALGDLRHRVPFEVLTEIGFTHLCLLASKLGKKASTNLGAIHNDCIENTQTSSLKLVIKDWSFPTWRVIRIRLLSYPLLFFIQQTANVRVCLFG